MLYTYIYIYIHTHTISILLKIFLEDLSKHVYPNFSHINLEHTMFKQTTVLWRKRILWPRDGWGSYRKMVGVFNILVLNSSRRPWNGPWPCKRLLQSPNQARLKKKNYPLVSSNMAGKSPNWMEVSRSENHWYL